MSQHAESEFVVIHRIHLVGCLVRGQTMKGVQEIYCKELHLKRMKGVRGVEGAKVTRSVIGYIKNETVFHQNTHFHTPWSAL